MKKLIVFIQGNAIDNVALSGAKPVSTSKLKYSTYGAKNKSYYINGQAYPINHDGYSGETPVTLKMNDTFDANLTATYLGGYTITKDSSDFGWPEGGIQVAARPAGELRLEISGGSKQYSLQELESGKPYEVKVYYQGTQLIGETTVAKREEFITRNRQDEYGIGFCLYEDQYPLTREAMSCEDTPFTPDRYPL